MKRFSTTLIVLTSFAINAQTQYNLDFNNVKASINTNGILFEDGANNSAGYEVPKNGGVSAIFSSAFWFSGEFLATGQFHLAAQTNSTALDLTTGPLSAFGGGVSPSGVAFGDANIIPSEITVYDRIWTISQVEIDNHLQNWNVAGYVAPQDLLDWPVHGDISLGQDYYIAPFYDNPNGPNGSNGEYLPLIDGDVPLIRGDKASYMILNDKGSVHASGGIPIGLELHYMIYQYGTTDYLNNTTFVNLKVMNRGTITLSDFKVGNHTDGDIGSGADDFFGSDSARSLMYTYNSDLNDDGGTANYGLNPPAIGVKLLNHNAGVIGYNSSSAALTTSPTLSSQYYGYMQGNWGNSGSPFMYGDDGVNGTVPTNFLFSDINGWNESSVGSAPADRKMFMCAEGVTLNPGDLICYDFAFLYGRSDEGTVDGSVLKLLNIADSVQVFYNDQNYVDCTNQPVTSLAVEENSQLNDFVIYPNPSTDYFQIKMDGEFDVMLYTMDGKLVFLKTNLNTNDMISHNTPSGMYIVKVSQKSKTSYQRVLIE